MSGVLDSFLWPVASSDFFARSWERAPLHVVRDASRHAGLFCQADADSVLSDSGGAWAGAIRAVENGAGGPLTSRPGPEPGHQAYRAGATLSFSALLDRWPAVRALQATLSAALGGPVNVNAYLTPPDSTGFPMHYDTHDVFVLQTSGAKRWRIHRPPIVMPLATQAFTTQRSAELLAAAGEPMLECELSEGDLLYVPRGFLHAAQSGPVASLHLTVGVHPPLVGSLLASALQSVIEQDPSLRAALPVGFAADQASTADALAALGRSALDRVDWPAVIASAARSSSRPQLDGHLLDLDALPSLDLHTPVRIRTSCAWDLHESDGRLSVAFHGKRLLMPLRIEPEIRFIGGGSTFTAAELPGRLDDDGRLVLVRRLVREGALTLA